MDIKLLVMLLVQPMNYIPVIVIKEIIYLKPRCYLPMVVLIQQLQYGLAEHRHGNGVLILVEYHYNKTVPALIYMEHLRQVVLVVILLLVVLPQ